MKSLITLKFEHYFPNLFVITFILYFFKNIFWPITYLVIPAYIILMLLFLFKSKGKFYLYPFFKTMWSALILLFIYIAIFLIDGNYSNTELQKSVLRLFILFSFFVVSFWLLNKTWCNLTQKKIFNWLIIITVIISIINLLKVLFQNLISADLLQKLNISEGFTIANDRNFFTLFIIFALIIINYHLISNSQKRYFPRIINIIFNVLLIFNIILSGSRRGILIFLVLFIIYFILILKNNLRKYNWKELFNKTKTYFILTTLVFIIGIIILKKVPQERISLIVYQYATIFDIGDYSTINRLLWEKKADYIPENNIIIDNKLFTNYPEYWSSPISLNNVLDPVNTQYGKGYHIKKGLTKNDDFLILYEGPQIMFYANHTYRFDFKIKTNKEGFNSFLLSIRPDGWYSNESVEVINIRKKTKEIHNGWYQCTAYYTFNNNHIGSKGFLFSSGEADFIISDFKLTDLDFTVNLPKFASEKQKQSNLDEWMDDINPPIYNDTSLINNGDFSSGLKYWVCTAENVEILIEESEGEKHARIKRGIGKRGYFSLKYTGKIIEFKANNIYKISLKVKPITPVNRIPFNVGFWVNEGKGYMHNLHKQIDSLSNGWFQVEVKYRFVNTHKNISFPINSQLLNSEFLIKDISLENLTQEQKMQLPDIIESAKTDDNSKLFYTPRTSRWLFAKEIWDTKYSWKHKLIGHGFDYFKWYGDKFYPDTKQNDWPHNPFITVLLYSGLIGLILYLVFLKIVVSKYLKFRKDYELFFIGFIITFFFSFFSANNPFNPPIMGFFVLLPFLFKHFENNE